MTLRTLANLGLLPLMFTLTSGTALADRLRIDLSGTVSTGGQVAPPEFGWHVNPGDLFAVVAVFDSQLTPMLEFIFPSVTLYSSPSTPASLTVLDSAISGSSTINYLRSSDGLTVCTYCSFGAGFRLDFLPGSFTQGAILTPELLASPIGGRISWINYGSTSVTGNVDPASLSVHTAPEPSTLILLISGLGAMVWLRRRKVR